MLEGVRMGNDTKKAIKAINDNTDIYDWFDDILHFYLLFCLNNN